MRKDDAEAVAMVERMHRLSAQFDGLHQETEQLCREATAEAHRAKREASKREPNRRRSPRSRRRL